jgi:tetratricopeptide (TPR) repeat protein
MTPITLRGGGTGHKLVARFLRLLTRSLAALSLAMTALAAGAETGPPTAKEVARAKADCTAEVRQDCLFTLALSAALQVKGPDTQRRSLNLVAAAQAKAGDVAGANRTLTLTEANEGTLLALGRWDEAYAMAKRHFAKEDGVTDFGTPEAAMKMSMVTHMLAVDEAELALATARSVPIGSEQRDQVLFLVFEHHLSRHDLAVASDIQAMMQDRLPIHRSRAFLALVEAYATAGQTAEATALLHRAETPVIQAWARLRLAKGYFAAGLVAEAKAQFDALFATATGDDAKGPPDWGLSPLIDAADLALSLGETAIARQHAEAAFAIVDRHKATWGAWFAMGDKVNVANPVNLYRVATLLQLTGSAKKAAILFAGATLPPQDVETPYQTVMRLTAQFVSQTRLQQADAARATLQGLIAMEPGSEREIIWRSLQEVAIAFAQQGFMTDAQAIADHLEALHNGGLSSDIYMALLAEDPSLAPALLPGIRTAYLQVDVSIAWARTLHGSGSVDQAQATLQALSADHATRIGDEWYGVFSYRVEQLAKIARAQSELGFAADAAETRQRGLQLVEQGEVTFHSVSALLSLAASFP